MPIWDEASETLDRQQMQQVQLERLQATVNRAYRNVRFYHRRLEETGVAPEDVQSLDDIARLPFTTRKDLQDGYPYEMLAVPLREVVRIDSSSVSVEKPIVLAFTSSDVASRANMLARTMSAAGVTEDDVVQIATEEAALAGEFGTQYALEKIGASVIPAGYGGAQAQIRMMRDFKSTVLISTPSYTRYLIGQMRAAGVDPDDLCLMIGLFGTEPMSRMTRLEIEGNLGIVAASNYGVDAVTGPGVAGECEIRDGLHVQEDHFLFEVVDPASGEAVREGETGELVVTTLSQEAVPIIRFRTGEMASMKTDGCRCGRTTARIWAAASRCDGAVVLRGVLVHPEEVEQALYRIEHVEPHFQICIDRDGGLDRMTLQVELSAGMFPDRMRQLMIVEKEVQQQVQAVVGVPLRVVFVEPQTLRDVTQRVVDNRDV